MSAVVAWDCETTTKQRFKRRATPFGDLNHVVLHGWKADGVVQHRYFGRTKPPTGWLKEVLQYKGGAFGTKLLVTFNGKFDLLHALQDKENLEVWMEYIAGGGQLWDCQLAEYLLRGMEPRSHMLSLDEVAPEYGGNVKVDEVKTLWNAGVDTVDIDPELLKRYLCGGPDEFGKFQMGDVENTEKIALAQIKRARECGQLNSIMLNMGALVFTVEAERNGMHVDTELGLRLASELKVEVDRLKAELERFLPEDLPFEFNWNSRYHKSALIFGGTVQWDAHEYDLADGGTILKHDYDALPYSAQPALVYAQKDETHYLLEDGSTMECLWWEHCANTEWNHNVPESKSVVVNKSGKNAGERKTRKVKVDNRDKPRGRAVRAPYTLAGFTTGNPEWESKTEPGVYSTASEVIEALGNRDVPFLKALAALQLAAKDLGTYYITTDPDTGEQRGMLSLVDEHGIIHHKLNMTNTVTGRLSSSDPNMQNTSKGSFKDGKQTGSQIKRVFVSRFGPDGKVIQSDFTALEIYVQAILTRCRQLIEDLKQGLDMHCVRVSQKEGKPYDETVKLCKGWTDPDGTYHPEDPDWKKKRTGAKEFSFQRAYGAGAPAIAESTGIPQAEIEALIVAEEQRYPEVVEYYNDIAEEIKANRKPGGYPIPHPEVRGVMCNLGTSHFRTPDGKLYTYREHPAPAFLVKRGTFASFSPPEIKNYVAQGSGGEWAKAAMWLAVRAFYARRNFNHQACLINQVHDAVYADSSGTVADEAAALLHACMLEASTFMECYFNWDVPVPVPSETTWGASLMEEGHIPGVNDYATPLRQELRDKYMQGYVPSFHQ